jgi:Fic family protein
MIKERKDIFEDNVINHIIGKVGKNPRNVLIACSNLNTWVKKEGKITLGDIKTFTNLLEKEIPSEEVEPEDTTEEVVGQKEKINWTGLEKRPSPTHKEILEYMFNKDGSVTVKEIAKILERKEKNIAIHLSKIENTKLIKKISRSRPVILAFQRLF